MEQKAYNINRPNINSFDYGIIRVKVNNVFEKYGKLWLFSVAAQWHSVCLWCREWRVSVFRALFIGYLLSGKFYPAPRCHNII